MPSIIPIIPTMNMIGLAERIHSVIMTPMPRNVSVIQRIAMTTSVMPRAQIALRFSLFRK